MLMRQSHKTLLMAVVIGLSLFSWGIGPGLAELLDMNEIISAQVMLLPASGKKIGHNTHITADNIS